MPNPLIPNDLSEDQLKWGYWFVTHKLQLRRILVIFLIVFSGLNIGYSIYNIVLDVMNGAERTRMLVELSSPSLNPAVTKAQSPKTLGVGNVQILVPQGRYDFIGTVSNSNKDFAARFSYRFVAGNVATAPETQFIMPGEQKFVVKLGVMSETRPSGAVLEITGVTWQRIDRHVYPDWQTYVTDHMNLPITDISYVPQIKLEGGKNAIGRTSFNIKNNTGYGYYGLRTLVLMYRGPAIVGVNSTVFSTLMPNQTASGEVTWYEDYGAVTQIKVLPEIDILKDTSFIRI